MVKLCNAKRWVCLPLALLLTVSALPGSATPSFVIATASANNSIAATDAGVAALREEIQLLRAELRRLDEEAAPFKEQVQGVLAGKRLMDQQIALLAREVACFDEMLAIYDRCLAESEAEYTALASTYDANFQVLAVRLRQSHEEGLPGLLELAGASDSILGFLTAIERQNQLARYDRSLMEALEREQGELSIARTALEKLRTERHRVAEEQVERMQLLNTRIQESGSYLTTLENDLDRFSYYIQQTQAGEQIADREIGAAVDTFLEKLAAEDEDYLAQQKAQRLALLSDALKGEMEAGRLQKGSEFYPGGIQLIWPMEIESDRLPSISARMGYCTYQVAGKVFTGYHSGVDLAATYGTKVVAAASGTVVDTGWQEGYGNYVVILHDDGRETRYAHLAQVTANEGDYLLQGEAIATAGSSGNSTGVGCHFELRIDGVLADPAEYLTLPTVTAPQSGAAG